MTRRAGIAVYVLLLLVCAAAWLVTTSAAALGAAVLLLLVPALSFLWNLLSRRTMTAQFSVQTFAEKNENIQGSLCVRYGGFFVPAGRVTAVLRVENELTGRRKTVPITLSPDGKEYGATFTFSSRHCGRLLLSVRNIRLWDVFSLLSVSVRANETGRCTVLPLTFPVDVTDPALPSGSGEADEYLPLGGGSDFTEVYRLREYVPGDAVRGMHWLLSAKRDTLIYRDPALAVQRSLLLFWDKTDALPDVTDALAEAIFSVSQALSEQGISFTLAFPHHETLRMEPITDIDTLSGVLPLLLRGEKSTAQPDVSMFGRTLWFTTSGIVPDGAGVTVICCTEDDAHTGSGIVCTPDTMRETLHRLDWDYEK